MGRGEIINLILLVEKGFCELAMTSTSGERSKLSKTTRMSNKWIIIGFTKSHERLLLLRSKTTKEKLHFVRKIRILFML